MRRLVPLAVATVLLGFATPAFAFGTTPDPGYGSGGVVTYSTDVFKSVVTQVGTSSYVAYSTRNGALAVERRDQSGALDSAYGVGGVFTTADNYAKLVTAGAAADGSVYLVFVPFNSASSMRVMRIAPDGTQDLAYGSQGSAQTKMSVADTPRSVIVDASDRAYIVGDRDPPKAKPTAFVLRLTATGHLDATFDGNGRRNFADRPNSVATGLAVGPRALVVVGSQGRTGLATRLLLTGRLDRTFANHGYATVGSKVGAVTLTSVLLAPTLRVAGVAVQTKPHQEWVIAGPLFGRHHRVALCAGCLITASPVLAVDGSVIAAGVRQRRGTDRPLLVGVLASGAPDPGIAPSGYAFVGPFGDQVPIDLGVDGSTVLVSTRSLSASAGATVTRFIPGP
jgi:hypothetical protein